MIYSRGSVNDAGLFPCKGNVKCFSEGQTQIQLELAEHEASSLKLKMAKVESENELMISRVSLLEKELE